MSAPESLRDEVAAAVYDATRSKSNRVSWADFGELSKDYWRGIADALLASPAFARAIREAKEEAWWGGLHEGVMRVAFPRWPKQRNPYRDEQP